MLIFSSNIRGESEKLRVITGTAKGRRLKAPKGLNTRPTSDRTKESLFNIIGDRVADTLFLDLFAGTGAIGIEALSRGAARAVFVEKSLRAIKIIRENLELTGLAGQAEVMCRDVDSALSLLAGGELRFGIVFLDPPYLKNLVHKTLFSLNQIDIIAPGGMVITESSKLDSLPKKEGRLELSRQEKYGDTIISFYQGT